MKGLSIFAAPVLAVALVAGFHQPMSADLAITIDGPKVARVGELIELAPVGTADRFDWKAADCSGQTADVPHKVKCNSLFFSSEMPGVFVFTLAAGTSDELAQVVHVVVVGKPADPVKPVDPVKPIDPVKPVEPVRALADKVYDWTKEVKSPLVKSEAAQLAAIYRAAPLMNPSGGQELADAIRMASHRALGPSLPFWTDWGEKLRQEVNAMKLKSFTPELCNQIASGLERASR